MAQQPDNLGFKFALILALLTAPYRNADSLRGRW